MSEKRAMDGLYRDFPETREGKYLVLRRDGTAVEWPHFVVGARDPAAPACLRAYADEVERIIREDPELATRCGFTAGYAASVRRLATARFPEYRATHGTSDPGKGRHRVDDPATVARMRQVMASA